jgi:hypothetical protein
MRPIRIARNAAVVTPLLMLGGCGVTNEGEWELGRVESEIANGSVDEEQRWNSVVFVRTPMPAGAQLCSGTLVAPNLVLSALHCVAALRDDNFSCNPDGTVTQTKPGAGELGTPASPAVIEIRTGTDAGSKDPEAFGKTLITTKSGNICQNDLALIVLDRDLDVPLSPIRLTNAMRLGEPLTLAGYGMTEGAGGLTKRRFVDNIRVQEIGADNAGNASSGAPPRTFMVGPGACKGDSGGPAFASKDGSAAVAGVNSIVVGSCGAITSRSIFTRLTPFEKLIRSAFEEAGYPVWLEGQPAPGVDPEPPAPEETTDDDSPSPGPQRLTTGCSIANTGGPLVPWASGLILGWLLCRRTRATRLR